VKNFAEDFLVYPVVYIGLCAAAVAANVAFWIWDAFGYLFSLLKKK
jgi:hypothetical protein